MKNTIFACICSMSISMLSQAQFNGSCLTNQLNISTGTDQLNTPATRYPGSTSAVATLDKFWQVTTIPANSTGMKAPACAQLLLSSLAAQQVCWKGTSGCAYLGIVSNPIPQNTNQLAPTGNFFWTCPPNLLNFGSQGIPATTPVTFARSFYIQSDNPENITISFAAFWADDIGRIRIDNKIVFDPTSSTTYGATNLVAQTLILNPGVHHVYVDVWDISAVLTGMALDANLSSLNNVLVKSTCFGASDANCAVSNNFGATAAHIPADRIHIGIYPNPSDGNFSIELSSIANTTNTNPVLECFDITGRLVYSQPLKAGMLNNISIPINGARESLLLYHIQSNGESIQYGKLLLR